MKKLVSTPKESEVNPEVVFDCQLFLAISGSKERSRFAKLVARLRLPSAYHSPDFFHKHKRFRGTFLGRFLGTFGQFFRGQKSHKTAVKITAGWGVDKPSRVSL